MELEKEVRSDYGDPDRERSPDARPLGPPVLVPSQ